MSHRGTILAIIAIVILVIYIAVPKHQFVKSVFPLRPSERVSVYDDNSDGGYSTVRMGLVDSLLDFECTLGKDTTKPAWCGLIWEMDAEKKGSYENWTLVDSLILDIESVEKTGIVLKVWTYDPDVTDETKLNTFRQLIKEVPLNKGNNHIALAMEDLYVPDFWYEQTGTSKNLTQRHQEHVARVEITPGWDVKHGDHLEIKIKKIEARGIGNIELAIFLGAYLILAIIAIGFLRKR